MKNSLERISEEVKKMARLFEEAGKDDPHPPLPTWGDIMKGIYKEIKERRERGEEVCICSVIYHRAEINELIESGHLEDLDLAYWTKAVDLTTVGHFDSAGGFCCPHWGNTCGRHEDW